MPFVIANGKIGFATNLSIVKHHRQAEELIAHITHHGRTVVDDELWEMVMKGHAVVAK